MDGKKQPTRSRYTRTPRTPFWLVIRHRRGRTEVLSAELVAGSRALPVFSFAEEVRMFVRLGLFEGVGWRAAKIGPEELASLLLGPLGSIERVALDPLPEVGSEPANRLLCLNRESFLNLLLDG